MKDILQGSWIRWCRWRKRFYDKECFEGVMLAGTMEVLQDEKMKEEIWREGDTLYYKKGVSDPDYCVSRFTAEKGRYYGNLKAESFTLDELE